MPLLNRLIRLNCSSWELLYFIPSRFAHPNTSRSSAAGIAATASRSDASARVRRSTSAICASIRATMRRPLLPIQYIQLNHLRPKAEVVQCNIITIAWCYGRFRVRIFSKRFSRSTRLSCRSPRSDFLASTKTRTSATIGSADITAAVHSFPLTATSRATYNAAIPMRNPEAVPRYACPVFAFNARDSCRIRWFDCFSNCANKRSAAPGTTRSNASRSLGEGRGPTHYSCRTSTDC